MDRQIRRPCSPLRIGLRGSSAFFADSRNRQYVLNWSYNIGLTAQALRMPLTDGQRHLTYAI
jgi:hypothetical protein